MMAFILEVAINDEGIRASVMNGSRAGMNGLNQCTTIWLFQTR